MNRGSRTPRSRQGGRITRARRTPPAPPYHPPLDPVRLMRRLHCRGLSVRAIAAQLQVGRAHLQRVLNGERPGSQALLESVAAIVDAQPARRRQDDVKRLIHAAVHMFFLKRGTFESDICAGLIRRHPSRPQPAPARFASRTLP